MTRTPLLAFAALLLTALTGAACTLSPVRDFVRGYASGEAEALADYKDAAKTPEQRGAVYFTLGDFGALNTDTLESHAVPWRLAAAALVQHEVTMRGGNADGATLKAIMTRFGFLYPETIANWPTGLAPPQPTVIDTPLGLSHGIVQRAVPRIRLTTANLSCAACHSGSSFDASGAPHPETAYLGAPNTSLDLEAYVDAVYAAFKAEGSDPARLITTMKQLFPDTTEDEVKTIRSFVLPRLNKRMAALAKAGDRALPFINGAPGLTNGVAALKMQLGHLPADPYADLRGFTAIPDLSARGFRTALLYDGAYAPAGQDPHRTITPADITPEHLNGLATVTAFFTVPSMGVKPERAIGHIAEAEDVFHFLEAYEPPRFPGHIDAKRAAQGRTLYTAHCAACHGTYDDSADHPRLVSFPNWIGPFDTDGARAALFDVSLAEAVSKSKYGDRLIARATNQYAAPPLSGLWLTAPYLHNGAVPTLWDLMHPKTRPVRFLLGGHRLNYERMGIDLTRAENGDYVYPARYTPWSTPALIDTTAPGLSNAGHEAPFDKLSEAEKQALLEYLKQL